MKGEGPLSRGKLLVAAPLWVREMAAKGLLGAGVAAGGTPAGCWDGCV